MDLRGHGSTKTDDEFNLSAETLSKDIGAVVQELYHNEPPPIILMGHSMGGAIAIHTAYRNYISSLIGLVVIDVVEGTAMDALSSMQSFLRGRPKSFMSLENAIEWWLVLLIYLENMHLDYYHLQIILFVQREKWTGAKY